MEPFGGGINGGVYEALPMYDEQEKANFFVLETRHQG